MACALASAFTNTPVRRDVAMTGEITLRGRVLPIGGLKEKILAANRAHIKTIILPRRNEKDLEDVPKQIRRSMDFVFADTMDEVFPFALKQPAVPKPRKERAMPPLKTQKSIVPTIPHELRRGS